MECRIGEKIICSFREEEVISGKGHSIKKRKIGALGVRKKEK